MNTYPAFLLVVLILGFPCHGQKIGYGGCPSTSIVPNLDVARYLGKWYEMAKYTNLFQNGICTEANYGPVNQMGQVVVLNKEIQGNKVVGVRGFARQVRGNSGGLQVNLRVPIVGEQQSSYDVLATDYDNYAVVHACRAVLGNNIKIEFMWILSRRRFLSEQHREEIQRVIERNRLDGKSLVNTQQGNCPSLDNRPFQLIA